jgi:hypothetical protein
LIPEDPSKPGTSKVEHQNVSNFLGRETIKDKKQGCQMAYFKTKNHTLGKFLTVL